MVLCVRATQGVRGVGVVGALRAAGVPPLLPRAVATCMDPVTRSKFGVTAIRDGGNNLYYDMYYGPGIYSPGIPRAILLPVDGSLA